MTNPTFICPSCKSDQIDILVSGLWDGEDKDGRAICGTCEYGICKQCGGRVAQYDGPLYVPTDEEWQRKIGPIEKRRSQIVSWPFEPNDDHVA